MGIKIEYTTVSVWALSEESARAFFGYGPEWPVCIRRDDLEPDTTKHKPNARVYEFDVRHMNEPTDFMEDIS